MERCAASARASSASAASTSSAVVAVAGAALPPLPPFGGILLSPRPSFFSFSVVTGEDVVCPHNSWK
jgi:hypothetical protein